MNAIGYIGDGIAVPHVRIDDLAAPELILGLSAEGFRLITIRSTSSCFPATPAEQPSQHLQLLQRIGSLLPAIRDELLGRARRGPRAPTDRLAEQRSALPTYLNLTRSRSVSSSRPRSPTD